MDECYHRSGGSVAPVAHQYWPSSKKFATLSERFSQTSHDCASDVSDERTRLSAELDSFILHAKTKDVHAIRAEGFLVSFKTKPSREVLFNVGNALMSLDELLRMERDRSLHRDVGIDKRLPSPASGLSETDAGVTRCAAVACSAASSTYVDVSQQAIVANRLPETYGEATACAAVAYSEPSGTAAGAGSAPSETYGDFAEHAAVAGCAPSKAYDDASGQAAMASCSPVQTSAGSVLLHPSANVSRLGQDEDHPVPATDCECKHTSPRGFMEGDRELESRTNDFPGGSSPDGIGLCGRQEVWGGWKRSAPEDDEDEDGVVQGSSSSGSEVESSERTSGEESPATRRATKRQKVAHAEEVGRSKGGSEEQMAESPEGEIAATQERLEEIIREQEEIERKIAAIKKARAERQRRMKLSARREPALAISPVRRSDECSTGDDATGNHPSETSSVMRSAQEKVMMASEQVDGGMKNSLDEYSRRHKNKTDQSNHHHHHRKSTSKRRLSGEIQNEEVKKSKTRKSPDETRKTEKARKVAENLKRSTSTTGRPDGDLLGSLLKAMTGKENTGGQDENIKRGEKKAGSCRRPEEAQRSEATAVDMALDEELTGVDVSMENTLEMPDESYDGPRTVFNVRLGGGSYMEVRKESGQRVHSAIPTDISPPSCTAGDVWQRLGSCESTRRRVVEFAEESGWNNDAHLPTTTDGGHFGSFLHEKGPAQADGLLGSYPHGVACDPGNKFLYQAVSDFRSGNITFQAVGSANGDAFSSEKERDNHCIGETDDTMDWYSLPDDVGHARDPQFHHSYVDETEGVVREGYDHQEDVHHESVPGVRDEHHQQDPAGDGQFPRESVVDTGAEYFPYAHPGRDRHGSLESVRETRDDLFPHDEGSDDCSHSSKPAIAFVDGGHVKIGDLSSLSLSDISLEEIPPWFKNKASCDLMVSQSVRPTERAPLEPCYPIPVITSNTSGDRQYFPAGGTTRDRPHTSSNRPKTHHEPVKKDRPLRMGPKPTSKNTSSVDRSSSGYCLQKIEVGMPELSSSKQSLKNNTRQSARDPRAKKNPAWPRSGGVSTQDDERRQRQRSKRETEGHFHTRTLLKGRGVPARVIPLDPLYTVRPVRSNGSPEVIPVDPRLLSLERKRLAEQQEEDAFVDGLL